MREVLKGGSEGVRKEEEPNRESERTSPIRNVFLLPGVFVMLFVISIDGNDVLLPLFFGFFTFSGAVLTRFLDTSGNFSLKSKILSKNDLAIMIISLFGIMKEWSFY